MCPQAHIISEMTSLALVNIICYKANIITKKETLCFHTRFLFCVGIYLFSQAAARQVSSAQVSLTSVFGMGTGGPSPQSTPTMAPQVGLEPTTTRLTAECSTD